MEHLRPSHLHRLVEIENQIEGGWRRAHVYPVRAIRIFAWQEQERMVGMEIYHRWKNCLRSWAYVDGQASDSQCRAVGSPTIWKESWRPCIVVPEMGQEQLAYYDADLLWGKSKPWGCNIERLRKDLCPPPPPALEDQWETVD